MLLILKCLTWHILCLPVHTCHSIIHILHILINLNMIQLSYPVNVVSDIVTKTNCDAMSSVISVYMSSLVQSFGSSGHGLRPKTENCSLNWSGLRPVFQPNIQTILKL